MKKKSLFEWSAPILEVSAIHYDRLDDQLINNKKGLELLKGSCELIMKMYDWYSNVGVEEDQYVLIVHCLDYDGKKLPKWKETYWNKIGEHTSPPEIYITKGRYGSFNHCSEFYSVNLELPFKKKYPLDCYFDVGSTFYEPDLTEFYPSIRLRSREPLGPKRK
ncbi:MAG: hypothetical protein SFY67_07525 [Candidatus Melainabacteria bacterium]|nr:hypothetical protein [Candidatus Melainabacteria bacterium]